MKRALSLTVAIVMLLSSLVLAPAAVAESDPVVSRFAVVSDVHVNPTSTANTIDRLPKVFSTAYAYAEKQGGTIDAFVFNGDNIDGNQTSKGYTNEDEFEIFFKGIKDNVKNGSKVLLTMARTHDIYDGDGNVFFVKENELNSIIAEQLGTDGSIIPAADWGYGPHLTMVNGVPVITLSNDMNNGNDATQDDDGNPNNDDNADNSYHDSEDWLDTTLASLVAENPNRAIFVVFHYPETGKLGWTQRWGQNSLRDTLNQYPQVITMNAHVHWDPRLSDSITQDRFTEVYDGGIRDVGGPNATSVSGGSSPIVSYSIVEVTQSGAVTIKYINPENGELLKEANGSGEVLEYSIPKAWDKSTYLYTDEAKYATEKATFAADASVRYENGTLTFDRAASEQPILRYKVEVFDGKTTKTQYVFSELYNATLPANYSVALQLKTGINYTVTVTAIDGIYRESANTLVLNANLSDPKQVLNGSATAVTEKTYGANGEKGEVDYPDFKTYATNPDAALITNWGISDREDLEAWSEFSKTNSCVGLTFHLENDIDMKEQPFGMIGSVYVPFQGTFDGHLHTLSNLLIDDASGMGTGFFVYLQNATVRNFGIESGLVRGHVSNRKYENAGSYSLSGSKRTAFVDVVGVGAIAGRADASNLTHVWNKADVTFRQYNALDEGCFAGLVGRAQNASTFVGCYNTGDVHGYNRASGITNWAQNGTYAARISNCFNLGAITSESGTTEAIARYNSVNTGDNPYFCYNNYYLQGSAQMATNRDANGYTANGAEEPIAITAAEVSTVLAAQLNAKRAYGALADTALWDTDAEGNVYIKALEENVAEKVITISTPAELNAFAANSKTNSYKGYTIVLQNDIDMSGTENFAMIGLGEANDTSFAGTFDGQGFTISNLKITSSGSNGGYGGMFLHTNNAIIKNFTLKNATMNLGRFSGMIAATTYGNTVIENVHIINSTYNRNSAVNIYGGFVGYAYKSPSLTTIKGSSIEGTAFNFETSQSIGGLIGENHNAVIENCCLIDNSFTTGTRSGLLIGKNGTNGATIRNCFTYGNTAGSNTVAAIGDVSATAAISNSIFGESMILAPADKNLTATNTYTLSTADAYATKATAAQLTSGELAYNVGMAMKDGKLTFADKSNAAAKCYTYVIDESTTEYRYTDYSGTVINGAPTVSAEDFLGWKTEAGAKEGDKILTAQYGTEDTGAYPISEMENHPKAKKFTISNAGELCTFATLSKSNNFAGYTISLIADIDLAGVAYAGIGSGGCHFMGTFDGENHTVYNMTFSGKDYFGFFRALEGTVKNFTIEDATVTVNDNDASAIVAAWAYGTTKLENVKVRYSTISQSGKDMVAAMIGWVNSNGTYTLENCVVESCSVSNTNQQAAALIGTYSHNVTVKNCKVINSDIFGHRQVGLIAAFATKLKVDGFIAYGNTLKCNYDSVGLIGRANNNADLQNVIAYNNGGTIANTEESAMNPTSYNYFGRYTSDNPTVSGSNLYNDIADTTAAPATVTTVNTAQIQSGEVAYLLGMAVKNGNIAFADATTKAALKYTYLADGELLATLYTDSEGALIGTAPALPEGADEWDVETAENGDKTFSVGGNYDVNGTYPISKLTTYTEATKFTVSTAEEFKLFADLVNNKQMRSNVTILQTANIDLKDYPNVQVGSGRDTDVSKIVTFGATYDGQNYTISNYTLTKKDVGQGLFKNLTGTVKNLVIENANISVTSHSGIVAGETYSATNLIENVHIKNSTITASARRVAFFVYGYNATGATVNVKNCTVSGSTMNTGTTANNPVGMIAIRDEVEGSVIENTYAFNNTINVQATGTEVSGIVSDGRLTKITNCGAFNNTYTGTAPSAIYGIDGTGATTATINHCYTDEAKLTKKTFTGSSNYSGVTDAELADGSLAYKLAATSEANWVQTTYPQVAGGKAVTKHTYAVGEAEYAVRYTDSEGKELGAAVTLPEGVLGWAEATLENGDKTFTAYGADSVYSISDFETYPNAIKFTVSNAAEFKLFADLVNAKKIGSNVTILQTANIDLKDYPNVQVGSGRDSDVSKIVTFGATYDGQNYTISNYTLTKKDVGQGLFKNLTGTVKNLVIENANISVTSHSGIVAGETYSATNLIENVHIKNSTITASARRVAFFVYGYNATGATVNVKNCTVSGSTMNTGTTANNPVGMIAIRDEVEGSVIENTYAFNNTINVQATGTEVSGIVSDGRLTKITNCGAFNNTYTGTAPSAIYGIDGTGATTATINHCYTDEAKLTKKTFTGSSNYSGVTDAELADGSLAYKLAATSEANWVQTTYPQVAGGQEVMQYTYVVNGETYALRYTDSEGKMIGTVTDPTVEGFTFEKWEQNGNTFTAVLIPIVVPGDLSGEGTVDTADAVLLMQYLVGKDVAATLENADMNGDQKISVYDAVLLLRQISE